MQHRSVYKREDASTGSTYKLPLEVEFPKRSNLIIDPSLIDCPVYIVAAEDEQIVPKSSILSLQKLLKNSKLIEVKSGHISYLINSKLDKLFKEYT
ncbi:hypothetical protein KNCP2_04110 [Candidatus Rickettsia kedanie]|uniref:Uncharacterized protein n=1 Tax=Candidatus Rickettsia kedanie TaxID=3115352 RepID=A0ABP9TUS3_9RICK